MSIATIVRARTPSSAKAQLRARLGRIQKRLIAVIGFCGLEIDGRFDDSVLEALTVRRIVRPCGGESRLVLGFLDSRGFLLWWVMLDSEGREIGRFAVKRDQLPDSLCRDVLAAIPRVLEALQDEIDELASFYIQQAKAARAITGR